MGKTRQLELFITRWGYEAHVAVRSLGRLAASAVGLSETWSTNSTMYRVGSLDWTFPDGSEAVKV